jgi:glycosyltransferase involved in cell wall biosynthesis
MSADLKTKRPRVLWVAEAANPKGFSVALIGWSFGRALRESADGVLATELRNRDDCVGAGAVEGIDLETVDNRFWQHGAWKIAQMLGGGKGLGWSTYAALSTLVYPIFERRLWRQFHSRLAAGEFDVVHRITPVSPSTPSLLAGRCAKAGVPFVLGPVNGGVPWPKEFPELRRAEKEWLAPFRGLYKWMPGYTGTRRHASAIIVASRSALAEMPREFHPKCVYVPENAIDLARFPRRPPPEPTSPLRVAFIGRLVPLKGVDMLIEAAAPLVKAGVLELDIIGDGPEAPRLKAMASDLGLGDRATFPGWVDHAGMGERLGRCHVFGFPSVREFGGGAVLEAMAVGLPPIVVDYGGPGELIANGCGIAVPMGERASIVNGFRAALGRLAGDLGAARAMGLRAQEHVYRNFTWPAKARQLREVYDWVSGRREEKPDWGMPFR